MKQMKKASTCLMAVALMTMVAAITASAAATALNGQLVLRPLTPGDVTNYKLPSTTENSGGLNTVGVGTPVYLEAEVNIAIARFQHCQRHLGSDQHTAGSFARRRLTTSPLGTNVPVYDPSDRTWSIKWPDARSCARTWWGNTRSSPPLSPPAAAPPM